MRLAQGLGQERDADHQFGAGADAGKKAVDSEVPHPVREALHCSKDGINGNTVGKGPDPPDVIGDGAEQQAAGRPAEQPGHAEKAADAADLRHRRIAAEQFGHGRPQDQRIESEIGGVEGPAEPNDYKNQPLIPADRPQTSGLCNLDAASVHPSPPPFTTQNRSASILIGLRVRSLANRTLYSSGTASRPGRALATPGANEDDPIGWRVICREFASNASVNSVSGDFI